MGVMFDMTPPRPAFLPFPQTTAYATAVQACGGTARTVDLGCGTALLLLRAGRQLLSRGPVWQDGVTPDEKRRALRRLARWPGMTLVTPEEELRGPGLIPLVTPVHHAIWPLEGDLRAAMAGKWRNRLVAAERQGARVQRGTNGLLHRLIAAEAAQRALRGYRTYAPEFSSGLPPRSLRLWEWRHAGQTSAAMAFVVEAGTAHYHLAWANADAKAQGIPALMLTTAAAGLQAEGVHHLDLGSVNSEDAPGLARFKLGTGAVLKPLGHTLLVLPG
jgi:hypothetical protein